MSSLIPKVLYEIQQVPDYPYDEAKDKLFLSELHKEFPTLDLPDKIRQWKVWLMDNEDIKKEKKVNYRSRFRMWCKKSANWKKTIKSNHEPKYEFEKNKINHPQFEEIW